MHYDSLPVSGNWRYDRVWQDQELTWANAIHRVAAEGVTTEEAVDEAIVGQTDAERIERHANIWI
jgi:hypothetical protein